MGRSSSDRAKSLRDMLLEKSDNWFPLPLCNYATFMPITHKRNCRCYRVLMQIYRYSGVTVIVGFFKPGVSFKALQN